MSTNISKTREQLLAELDILKQKLVKTTKLEKVLIASNQQLEASEQQLSALNQQLAASNLQLAASDEKFRSVVEASPMGMHFYTLKPDGKLVFSGANPAAESCSVLITNSLSERLSKKHSLHCPTLRFPGHTKMWLPMGKYGKPNR